MVSVPTYEFEICQSIANFLFEIQNHVNIKKNNENKNITKSFTKELNGIPFEYGSNNKKLNFSN